MLFLDVLNDDSKKINNEKIPTSSEAFIEKNDSSRKSRRHGKHTRQNTDGESRKSNLDETDNHGRKERSREERKKKHKDRAAVPIPTPEPALLDVWASFFGFSGPSTTPVPEVSVAPPKRRERDRDRSDRSKSPRIKTKSEKSTILSSSTNSGIERTAETVESTKNLLPIIDSAKVAQKNHIPIATDDKPDLSDLTEVCSSTPLQSAPDSPSPAPSPIAPAVTSSGRRTSIARYFWSFDDSKVVVPTVILRQSS